MAVAGLDYGALLRRAAPCARLIVLEMSGGCARGGGATASAHQERLLRQALLGGALPAGTGGGATATAQERHVLQILQGGALTRRGGEAAAATHQERLPCQALLEGALPRSGGGGATATAHEQLVRQILRGGALTCTGWQETAATVHELHVHQLLLGDAHPNRAGEAADQEHQLRFLLGIGGALTGRAGEGVLTGRGGGATTTYQGLQPCQMLLLDGALDDGFLHDGSLRLRNVAASSVGLDRYEFQATCPFPLGHFAGTTASMAIPGLLFRKATLEETDFQLRAIGFRPCSRSRLFLLFIAFGYVSQSTTELLSFVKKAGKFLANVQDFTVDRLGDSVGLVSQAEFIGRVEEMLLIATQVC